MKGIRNGSPSRAEKLGDRAGLGRGRGGSDPPPLISTRPGELKSFLVGENRDLGRVLDALLELELGELVGHDRRE